RKAGFPRSRRTADDALSIVTQSRALLLPTWEERSLIGRGHRARAAWYRGAPQRETAFLPVRAHLRLLLPPCTQPSRQAVRVSLLRPPRGHPLTRPTSRANNARHRSEGGAWELC